MPLGFDKVTGVPNQNFSRVCFYSLLVLRCVNVGFLEAKDR